MTAPFTPLHAQSDGSLLRGCIGPRDLVRAAAELGHTAIALTDRDSMAHAVTFYQAALDEGVRPILGFEVDRPELSAVLLAADREGFANICALSTRIQLEPGCRADQALLQSASGLFALTDHALTLQHLRALPPGRLAIRMRAGRSCTGLAEHAVRLARDAHLPLVATGEALFLEAGQREVRQALAAVREKRMLATVSLDVEAPAHARLLSPAEGAREFDAWPEALDEAARIAGECRVELSLGRPIFPDAPLPPGADAIEYLRGLCEPGVNERYSPSSRPAARARLRHELSQIHSMGFTPYFLLVADIMAFARRSHIPSVGRGSGASSLVAYSLGITNVDPILHRLHFERFLHPERPDCPDLDIDLCWKRRDEVIDHVLATYGSDRAAMIGTHAAFGFRSAFREVVKLFGLSQREADKLGSRLPRELPPEARGLDALTAIAPHAPARAVNWREPALRRSLELSMRLEGRLHHPGLHPGGVVIGDRALTRYLGLQRSSKGVIATQCEMRAVEALGLVKMDLLGNRAVTEIGDTLASLPPEVREIARRAPDLDAPTVALLREGRAMSCFQLESPAMRHLLRQMRPADLEDTIAAVALIRPGAAGSGMKDVYLKRRRGLEPVADYHPWLREVLGPTHGLLLYEEDVMMVAATMLGQSAAEGDLLRRAISGAESEVERASMGEVFVKRCVRRGVEPAAAARIWGALARFASYAFCRAHAAGYGVLAWHTAYLKAHHPAEFYCAVFNNHQGMFPRWVHIEEARRGGVVLRGPCVNGSQDEFALERGGAGGGAAGAAAIAHATAPAVRAGLACIASLSEGSRARLLAEREARGPFLSMADFLGRVPIAEREARAMVEAGAFDFTARTRPSLLFELAATHDAYKGATHGELFSERRAPCALPALPEYPLAERLRREFDSAGFAITAPPLAPYEEALAAIHPVTAETLERAVGRRVSVAGIPCAARRVRTKTGEPMFFLTLADATGLVECTFFPDVYRRSPPPYGMEPLRVEGRVEEQMGAVTVTASGWDWLAGKASLEKPS